MSFKKHALLGKIVRLSVETGVLSLLYAVGCNLSRERNYMAFFFMLLVCVAFFVYFAVIGHNLLDLRGVVFSSITGSVAVCQLRLSAIQVVWETETWMCFALGLICFNIGYFIFDAVSSKIAVKQHCFRFKFSRIKEKIAFGFRPKRVYYATIFLAVMPIVLFCIQVWIKGFIPIFVQRYDAYILFYTRLSIFINLVIFSAPLAFWCLKNLELNTWQRIVMYAIIPLPTVIFQLMVQRGLFVWSICILLVMLYFQCKHKLLSVVIAAFLLVFGIVFSSAMRGIPVDAMQEIWKIDGNITIFQEEKVPGEDPDNTALDQQSPNNTPDNISMTINIPEFVYAPYYYIINGVENFNYMIANLEEHSFGLKQIQPLTVILRFQSLKDEIAKYPSFAILPSSTDCIFSDFYYDFGTVGIILESVLVGFLSAFIQRATQRKKDLFALLEYGVLFAVLLTAFFAAWLSVFGTWLFAGTAFLIFLYCYFSPKKREKSNEN